MKLRAVFLFTVLVTVGCRSMAKREPRVSDSDTSPTHTVDGGSHDGSHADVAEPTASETGTPDSAPPDDGGKDRDEPDGSQRDDGGPSTDGGETPAVCPNNLVENGNFDENIDGWRVILQSRNTIEHDERDADESSESGSLRSVVTNHIGQRARARQCIAITGGAAVQAQAEAWIAGDGGPAEVVLVMAFYSTANCGGSVIGGSRRATNREATPDTWHQLELNGAAPDTARSLNFSMNVYQTEDQPVTTYWDNACVVSG